MSLEIGSLETQRALPGRPTLSQPAGKLVINFAGGLCAGRESVVLEQMECVIGRGDDCGIRLEGETVSRHHCVIKRIGGAYFLENKSRNGTYLNGARVTHSQLRDQDQVRVGQNFLLIRLASGLGTAALSSKATAPGLLPYMFEIKPHIVIKGLEAGVTQPFGEDRVTIGRRADNHLVLEADNISRQHLCIERRGEQYFAVDSGSSNGTYLNGQRIQAAPLKDGDCLRFGDFTLTVRLRGQDCILNFKQNHINADSGVQSAE